MTGSEREQIIHAVTEFVNAQRWSETRQLLHERTAELWSDEADVIFGELVEQYASDGAAAAQIGRRWDILKAARDDGIDAAYERAQGIGTRRVISQELMLLVKQAIDSGEQAQLDDVLDRFPEMIPVLRHIQQSAAEDPDPAGGGA